MDLMVILSLENEYISNKNFLNEDNFKEITACQIKCVK